MTASYTNQPGVRDIDTVRLRIADTDTIPETDAALSDEEIQYFIDSSASVLYAAANAAETIGAKYAELPVTKTVDGFTLSYGDGQSSSYAMLAKRLRRQAASNAKLYAGGLSKSDKTAAGNETDRVQPVFTLGMHDHAGTDTTIADC